MQGFGEGFLIGISGALQIFAGFYRLYKFIGSYNALQSFIVLLWGFRVSQGFSV